MTADVRAAGFTALAALARASGRIDRMQGLAATGWRLAGGEPIWVGERAVAMHPRAVVVGACASECEQVEAERIPPWRLPPLEVDRHRWRSLARGCIALAANVRSLGSPAGLAAVLTGEPPAFPLEHAVGQVRALAAAIDRDDAPAACAWALPLLGLGPGLTPSGDDFVGAVLYAQRVRGMSRAWNATAQRLVEAARTRTHAIGAALFRDLAQGESFAALQCLAAALASGGHALAEARAVVSIGHSSGWDMLAGFIVGAAGTAALVGKAEE